MLDTLLQGKKLAFELVLSGGFLGGGEVGKVGLLGADQAVLSGGAGEVVFGEGDEPGLNCGVVFDDYTAFGVQAGWVAVWRFDESQGACDEGVADEPGEPSLNLPV